MQVLTGTPKALPIASALPDLATGPDDASLRAFGRRFVCFARTFPFSSARGAKFALRAVPLGSSVPNGDVPLHRGGWKVFLFTNFWSKSLGKAYAGPGLSRPLSGIERRCDGAVDGRDCRSPPRTIPFFAPLVFSSVAARPLADATKAFTVAALLHLVGRLGPAKLVPRSNGGRMLYCPGPGVSVALHAPFRVRSRFRYRVSRKPGDVARTSRECIGPRRCESGPRRGVGRSHGDAQLPFFPTCIGPVFVATSPHAWSPPRVLTPFNLVHARVALVQGLLEECL